MKEISPVPDNFDIQSQLKEIEEDLSIFTDEKKIIFENNTTNLTINTDKEMFKLILRNLITNAIKYTNPFGKVVINSILENKKFIISVKDTGIGIRQEVQNKLFILSETKAELGTYKETGTGLGLVLCADFVKKLGGKIWVESKVGKGSTFYTSIPLCL
ncbi:MAG: HAMP domain-containing histidine kinase [Marinilabiliaceae bacterium]|nr:HAMP domain-containing histidine kinase [Marinilabiliaceae bacterium]